MTCRSSGLLLGVLLGCVSPGLVRGASAEGERRPIATTAQGAALAPRVRVLVIDSVPEFGARVRGQLSDLDVLLQIDAPAASPPRGELASSLAEMAARRAADVIAWLGEAPGDAAAGVPTGIAVHMWIAGRDRVYSRRIGRALSSTPAPRQASDENHAGALGDRPLLDIGAEQSATLETAALFLRGAVRSVLFDRAGARDAHADVSLTIESPPAGPAREVAIPPAARTAPPLSPEPVADSAPTRAGSRSTRLAWAPHAGLDWTYAGLSRSGSWAIGAGLGLRLGRFSVGAEGRFGFPEMVRQESVELSLQRQILLAEIGWEALHSGRFALRPTLRAGAAWLSRSSITSAVDLTATSERRSLSALASFDLVAEYELTSVLRLSASSGLNWLSHVPRFAVGITPTRHVVLLEAWRWQPNAGIALGAIF